MLSARRSIVEISRMVGKAESSSGLFTNSAVIRMRTETVIEMPSIKSNSDGGSGKIRIVMMPMMARANMMSPRRAPIRAVLRIPSIEKNLGMAGASAMGLLFHRQERSIAAIQCIDAT